MNLALDPPSRRRKLIRRELVRILSSKLKLRRFHQNVAKRKLKVGDFYGWNVHSFFIYESRHQGLWPLLPIQA